MINDHDGNGSRSGKRAKLRELRNSLGLVLAVTMDDRTEEKCQHTCYIQIIIYHVFIS
jgi:hypothetical protein